MIVLSVFNKNDTFANNLQKTKQYKGNSKRQAVQMLPAVLQDAISFPQQINLIEESLSDMQLAGSLAERFGVDVETF